jgi:hypothetical protein
LTSQLVKRRERSRSAVISAKLRAEAAGRGGEAGRSKLKAFRNRVLAIPHRVEYLSARQTLALTQELRACLDELADDAA